MSIEDISVAIKEKEEYNKSLTDYVSLLQGRSEIKYPDKLSELASFRDYDVQLLKDQGIFYVGEAAELLLPQYLNRLVEFGVISPNNNKPIYHNRWVMPIKDSDGLVQNLVGYSPDSDERYIYGTARYYRRADTLYGLENINEAYQCGYAILTEGITDAICLRNLGYKVAFGRCGTRSSDYVVDLLNRCKYGVIRIPDRDNAGLRALKDWKFNRHVTLFVNLQYKDVDQMCRNDETCKEIVKQYIDHSIGWLKQSEHRGIRCGCEEYTML